MSKYFLSNRLKKITRYGQPGILDEAPHGAVCFVPQGTEQDIYVQVAPEGYPRWELLGTYDQQYNAKQLKKEVEKFKNLKFGNSK